MSLSRIELESAVKQLPRSEQLQLVETVLQFTGEDSEVDAELWWLLEAERRLEAVRNSKMTTRPADDVFRDLERSLP